MFKNQPRQRSVKSVRPKRHLQSTSAIKNRRSPGRYSVPTHLYGNEDDDDSVRHQALTGGFFGSKVSTCVMPPAM